MDQTANKYNELIQLINEFITVGGCSKDFVRTIESSFAACELDDYEEFSGLQHALAMFGAGDIQTDTETLVSECRAAVTKLESLKKR